MKFVKYETKEGENYLFSIGTKAYPDKKIKERIREQIDTAMAAVGYKPNEQGLLNQGYSQEDIDNYKTRWGVIVTHEPGERATGEATLPALEMNHNYLMFGILDDGEYTDEQLDQVQQETAEMIQAARAPSDTGKTAFVALRNCTIDRQVMSGYKQLLVW